MLLEANGQLVWEVPDRHEKPRSRKTLPLDAVAFGGADGPPDRLVMVDWALRRMATPPTVQASQAEAETEWLQQPVQRVLGGVVPGMDRAQHVGARHPDL